MISKIRLVYTWLGLVDPCKHDGDGDDDDKDDHFQHDDDDKYDQ